MNILISIAPVFVLICLGYALRRGGIPSTEFWNLNDRLVYFLLMPALFFVCLLYTSPSPRDRG